MEWVNECFVVSIIQMAACALRISGAEADLKRLGRGGPTHWENHWKAESFETYGWWKKSTAPVDDSKSRICYSIVHISTGAGFPPSTVLTQKIWRFHPLKLDFSPHMYPYATGNRVPHALEITSPEQLKKGPLFWLYKWLNPTMLNADHCNDEWDMDYCPLGVLGLLWGTRCMKLYRSLFIGLFMLLLHHPPFPSWMGMNKPLNMTERAPSTEMAA